MNYNSLTYLLTQIVSCKVSRITPEELVVELIPSGVIASLPMKHLSDYDANCLTLLQTFKIGDVIEKVVCFSNKLYPVSFLWALYYTLTVHT